MFYLMQDDLFLKDMDEARRIVLARSSSSQAEVFSKITDAIERYEIRARRDSVLEELKNYADTASKVVRTPTTLAYTSYLIRVAATCSFQEAVAALAACPRLYLQMGKIYGRSLAPKHPVYGKWLSIYTSAEYVHWVDSYTGLLDSIAREADAKVCRLMLHNYTIACNLEWMFWDAAYRMEGWPAQEP